MAELRRLEDWLLHKGEITPDQLLAARTQSRTSRVDIAAILIQKGWITEEIAAEGLSLLYRMPLVDLGTVKSSKAARGYITAGIALSHLLLPLQADLTTIDFAIADPVNVDFIEDLKAEMPLQVRLSLAPPTPLREAIVKAYGLKRVMKLRSIAADQQFSGATLVEPQYDRQTLLENLDSAA